MIELVTIQSKIVCIYCISDTCLFQALSYLGHLARFFSFTLFFSLVQLLETLKQLALDELWHFFFFLN